MCKQNKYIQIFAISMTNPKRDCYNICKFFLNGATHNTFCSNDAKLLIPLHLANCIKINTRTDKNNCNKEFNAIKFHNFYFYKRKEEFKK